MVRAIVLHREDNVATMIDDGQARERARLIGEGSGEIELRAGIPFGHKFATRLIPKGGKILKYGHVIGQALSSIEQGAHVHVHNVEALRGRGDL
ncbi:MAG: UxaA family hydrolase [Dongiaceae bacterium]